MSDADVVPSTVATEAGGRGFGIEQALFALSALPGPYLPWSSGAMRPAGLVAVCNDVVLGDRRHVVELGSGSSTVMLARLLRQLGGPGERRLTAVEHDARWCSWVTGQLQGEGLGEHARVIEAPLRAPADGGLAWYDETAVEAAIDIVDLLVVDGPPAYEAGLGLARHRALAVFRDRLSPGATVVLDDIERPGEQDVLRRWEDEFDLTFERDETTGLAVARVS